MEFCSGGDLYNDILKTTYSEKDTSIIVLQVLQAVAYCHTENVVHRDIKLENILIDSDQQTGELEVKLTDFGVSATYEPFWKKKRKNHKYMVDMVGSPHYIAPEVLVS